MISSPHGSRITFHVRLRLRLSCLDEIEQWVLSWGTRATVIRPQALADRIAHTARELASRYTPAPSPMGGV